MAIGINDKLERFRELCVEHEACEEALVWLDNCIAKKMRLRDMIEAIRVNPEGADWCIWARLELADDLTPSALMAFSDEGTKDDSRMAAHLDIHVATSPSEGNMLASRWSEKELPNIARQLKEGTVKRKRD